LKKSCRKKFYSEAGPVAAGFTLLELVIAMALLTLVATLLLFATNNITSSWSGLLEEQNSLRETMKVGRTLDRILSNAVPFVWRNEKGEKVPVFYGQMRSIRIAYRQRVKRLRKGGLKFVRLSVEDGQFIADYQSRPFIDATAAGRNMKRSILAEDIKSVRFYYADWHPEEGLFWRNQWDPNMADPPRTELPVAVGLSVTWDDGRREAWLRRTAGNGSFERFGSWSPPKTGKGGGT